MPGSLGGGVLDIHPLEGNFLVDVRVTIITTSELIDLQCPKGMNMAGKARQMEAKDT